VTAMCSKFFAPVLNDCKFENALTALDYLQSMERSRQLALRDAAKRLGIHEMNFQHLIETDTMIKYWVISVDQHSPHCDSSYATCHMGLRLWVSCAPPKSSDL
jgi:hypothetical protein